MSHVPGYTGVEFEDTRPVVRQVERKRAGYPWLGLALAVSSVCSLAMIVGVVNVVRKFWPW